MRILVAIDGSQYSDAAVVEVAQRPWPPQSEARLIIVDAPVEPSLVAGGVPTAFDEIVKQRRAESYQHLRQAVDSLTQRAPGLRVTSAQLEGSPKDTIVAEAERWGADLVVVGSHGYGPVRRFFLGSVSLYVAHHAPCSVEIVRSPADAAGDS